MSLKPIVLWGSRGPNPPKVAFVLKELDLPFEHAPIEFSEVKQAKYLAINPNGRLPSIQDPNTNLTLWESGAIVEYLVEKYDTEYKISFAPDTPEYWHARQYLYFQTTGQGPYFGQVVWFIRAHEEKLPSAVGRYVKEVIRVTTVLESILAKEKEIYPDTDGPWLVGNKYSYADLSFLPWYSVMKAVLTPEQFDVTSSPLVSEWLTKITERPAIKSVLQANEPKKS
ncbi:glutathione S-transferase [Limtongia smithiae]|uniref:glutathione S-transferase n=1 Tax=Limtongia smithiae TaxID=1125753 RepID=UPI0034CD6323